MSPTTEGKPRGRRLRISVSSRKHVTRIATHAAAIAITIAHIIPRCSVTSCATILLNSIVTVGSGPIRTGERTFRRLHSHAPWVFADCAKFPDARQASPAPALAGTRSDQTRAIRPADLELGRTLDRTGPKVT